MARAQTLSDLLAQRRVLPLAELIPLFSSVLEDLEKAHAQNHLHGDIKPRKIVQVEDRVWRLIDYGVSKIGTARYLAPEKAKKQPVDARADLYSLGVVLYESATGRLPFEAELGAELIQAHITQPPPPPSSLKPDIPKELERVILRALEKDPARRFQSARDFRAALIALMPREPEPSTPTQQQTAQPVKTRPVPESAPTAKPMAPPRKAPTTPVVSPQPTPAPRSKTPVIIIILLLALTGATALFILTNSRKVLVPDVIGKNQNQARKSLEAVGLSLKLGPDKDDRLPTGLVADQNPKPGLRVKRGASVEVRLSTGMIELPELRGSTRADAEKLLRAQGIDSIIFSGEYSDEIEPGKVIRSEPGAGTRIKIRTPVRLRIANGRATCPVCGTKREPGAQFCTSCGYRFPE